MSNHPLAGSALRVLIAGVAACGVLMTLGSPTHGEDPTSGGSTLPTPAGAPQMGTPLLALTARTVSLDENGDLHLTSKQGFTLNEQGPASGTITGTIHVHLKIVSSGSVTAEVSIYPRGGSISGIGTASYKRGTTTASFSGTLSISHGTGSYANAHGSGLSFSGTIQRSNDAIAAHVNGRFSQ
jgi:hypothetical protein